MYKLKNILNVSLFLLLFVSCSANPEERFANKEAYIKDLSDMSDAQRKEQLEKDIKFIETSLNKTKDLTMFFVFSFRMGDGSSSQKIDEAKPFSIASEEDYKRDFKKINDSLIYANQKFTQGDGTFDFADYNLIFDIIDRSDLKYTVKGVFENGKKSKKLDNYLVPVDSVNVDISYSYATAFDTVVINNGVDSVLYNKQTLYVKSSTDNSIEMIVPAELKVLGYKALSTSGILMDKNSFSSFPFISFSPIVYQQISKAINLMKKAARADDKAQSLSYLQEIPEDTFTKMSLMPSLLKEYNKKEDDKKDTDELIKDIKSMMEKYASLLSISTRTLDLSFPGDYKQIYLYVATQTQVCDTSITVKLAKDGILPYNIFTDSTHTKYGIVDNKGKIIIPATYSKMIQYDSLYFNVEENNKEVRKYLNPQTLKFESLPADMRFEKNLTSALSVFSNKDGYYGLLKDNKTEVMPFKFDDISKIGQTIIAQSSKHGRPYFLFYTLDGKQKDLEPVKKIYTDDKTQDIIIVSASNKNGYINNQGVLTIAPKYNDLGRIGNNLLGFVANNEDLVGIIDTNGNIILEPTYNYIGSFYDNRALVKIKMDNNSYYDNAKYGYIDNKGKIVVELKYSRADDFYKGYALVVKNDIYYLIDTDGNIVKSFDADYVSFYQDDDSESTNPTYFYQTSDGKRYNYKGEPIK